MTNQFMTVGRKGWESECPDCCGEGYVSLADEAEHVETEDCETCEGKGYIDRREE